MKKYNKRQNNNKTKHPCDHTENRSPKQPSPNVDKYKDTVTHARHPDGHVLCNAQVLGVMAGIDEPVTCNKCRKLFGK